MTKRILILICIGLFSMSFIRKDQTSKNAGKFSKGEKLTYLAHYGFINAGRATVKLDKNIYYKNGRPCYKVDVDGWTVGMFSLGMKVKDKWRSYIDTSSIIPHEFYRDISENKYKLKETTYFNKTHTTAKVKKVKNGNTKYSSYSIPAYSQDLVSSYYYLRTIDFDKLRSGDKITVKSFFEDEVYDMEIVFLGRETVKTKVGKIKAFKMRPIMPENDLFDGEDSILFWVSDDDNKVPLKVRAKMFIGAVEVELTGYSGLRSSFNWAK